MKETILIPGEVTLMTRDYCGRVIYRDGVLERIMGDYGYMDGTRNYHYFIKDFRQGNPMVHEFGHFLGLKDHYHLSSNKQEREKGKQYPDLGWENNIMGTTANRGIVEQRNFHQVFRTINNIERSVNMIRKAFRTAPSFTPQMKYNYIINKYTREWQ